MVNTSKVLLFFCYLLLLFSSSSLFPLNILRFPETSETSQSRDWVRPIGGRRSRLLQSAVSGLESIRGGRLGHPDVIVGSRLHAGVVNTIG